MTYPLSSPVTEGQATEAAQYNNLRSDAVFLGGDPAASGTLRDLLYSSAGVYSLVQEGKTTIKLPASSSAPVGLMIGGGIYSVSENLTLSVSSASTPAAGRYTVYAIASGGAFSLALSSTGQSRAIGSFCWDGSGIIPGTLHTSSENIISAALKQQEAAAGRLSLVAGNPVTDEDIDQAVDLYFVPYRGNRIWLYISGGWECFEFGILSLSRSGMTAGNPYDIFITADSNGLKLVSIAWGSSSARAVGSLVWLDGVRVSGSNNALRYVGTVILNDSGYFEDSKSGRLVWNENNRVTRPILAKLITAKTQGTNHINSWSPYYDEDAPFVRLLVPGGDCEFELTGLGLNSRISDSDGSYLRSAALGILQDPMTVSPYTGNVSCAPVYTHTIGNTPMSVEIENYDSGFIGYHKYYLGFWTNYNLYPSGTNLSSSMGECPGLYGTILG